MSDDFSSDKPDGVTPSTDSGELVSAGLSDGNSSHQEIKKLKSSRWQTAWGPWDAIGFGLLAFVGGQLLVGFAVGIYLILFGMTEVEIAAWLGSVTGLFIFMFIAEVFVAILIISYVRIKHGTARQLGFTTLQWHYILVALAGMGAYFGLYVVLALVAGTLSPQVDFEQEQQLGFEDPVGGLQLLMVGISLVVLPPIVEEITFRGFMYAGFRRAMPFVWSAIITSVLFAVGHLEFGSGKPLLWAAAIDTFALSMVMCYVREKTGSIWPTIFMHAIKNGVAFTYLYLLGTYFHLG